jgi:Predicted pyrophosphatase
LTDRVNYLYTFQYMTDETVKSVLKFRDDRDWKQFHNPKDLAISLSLEASELLELFQWKTSEEAVLKNRDKMADELADVLAYAISFADVMEFDLDEIVAAKYRRNGEKYPVALAKGNKTKYNELETQARGEVN